MSTRLDTTVLREIVDKATPGPWDRLAGDYGRRIDSEPIRLLSGGRKSVIVCRVESHEPQHHHDAAYIATFSPATTRLLLDELDELRHAIDLLRENWPKTIPAPMDRPISLVRSGSND